MIKIRLFVSLLSLLILSSCQKPVPVEDRLEDLKEEPSLIQKGVRFDLVEYFPVAEIHQPVRSILFDDSVQTENLTTGWYPSEGKAGRSWIKGGLGIIEVPVVSREPMTIKLKVSPIPKYEFTSESNQRRKIPVQSLRVTWNGIELENVLLKRTQEVEIDIPADQQILGPNQLVLAPGVWLKPYQLNRDNKDGRDLGVYSGGIQFETQEGISAPLPEAARLDGETIVQYPNSVISYYFDLPKHPTIRLTGRIRMEEEGLKGTGSGRITIAARTNEGSEQILFEEDVTNLVNGEEFTLKDKLSGFESEIVGIHLSVSGRLLDASPAFHVEWAQAAIDGIEEQPAAQKELASRKYNLILVCFDALRADCCGPYGNKEIQTPGMDRLSRQGTVFDNCYSTASYTSSSVSSYLTSTFESVHRNTGRGTRLPDDLPILQEILKDADYNTALFSCNANICEEFGFKRGFDICRELYSDPQYMMGEQRVELLWSEHVKPYLQDRAEDRDPFFLYVHAIDPHAPYIPPATYEKMYDPTYKGNVSGDLTVLDLIDQKIMPVTKRDLHHIKALYQAEITNVDRILQWMLNEIEQSGLAENTVVVFISDHGEEFYEHQRMEHSRTLYREALHVPMIWSLPGVIPVNKRVSAPVQLIDIAPTLLNLVGAPVPESMQGMNLGSLFELSPDIPPVRPLFSSRYLAYQSVLYKNMKLIRNRPESGLSLEYYDWVSDPTESINRWTEEPVVVKTLNQMIDWQLHLNDRIDVSKVEAIPVEQMNPELLQQLRALGYMD